MRGKVSVKPRVLLAGPDRSSDRLEPYAAAVRHAGGEPHLEWPAAQARGTRALTSLLSRYDGLLLPGGADVDPRRYGEEPHPSVRNTDHDLDEVQVGLAKLALELDFPTLAICRGLQVMAVAAGGTLYQDLPSQRCSDIRHRVTEPKDFLAHSVEVEPGSLLAEVSGSSAFEVNSRHHQAAREGRPAGWIGPLRVVAWAPDGVVEGLEHPQRSFLVAVQWHPENLVPENPAALALLKAFIEACIGRSRDR